MKKYLSLIYKSILVILSILGILIQIGVLSNHLNLSNLNYYTLISNLVCSIYFIIDIIFNIKHFKEDKIYIFSPMIKSMASMGITVTMLVVIFVLGDIFPTRGLDGFSFLCLHYIVPIMVICDWLIFDEKGKYEIKYSFTNMILPIIYFIYVVILVNCGYSFSFENRYPYEFLNIDKLGLLKVMMSGISIMIFFVVLGFIYYLIDNILKKKS